MGVGACKPATFQGRRAMRHAVTCVPIGRGFSLCDVHSHTSFTYSARKHRLGHLVGFLATSKPMRSELPTSRRGSLVHSAACTAGGAQGVCTNE